MNGFCSITEANSMFDQCHCFQTTVPLFDPQEVNVRLLKEHTVRPASMSVARITAGTSTDREPRASVLSAAPGGRCGVGKALQQKRLHREPRRPSLLSRLFVQPGRLVVTLQARA